MCSTKRVVGIELRRLNNLIAREVSKMPKEPPFKNVTDMHANVMDYLHQAGPDGVMQKEIEQAFTIRKSTVSRILKLMEKNGVIERHGVDYDARLKKITLSPKAREDYERVKVYADQLEQRISKGITQAEMDTFFDVLAKMQHNLEK